MSKGKNYSNYKRTEEETKMSKAKSVPSLIIPLLIVSLAASLFFAIPWIAPKIANPEIALVASEPGTTPARYDESVYALRVAASREFGFFYSDPFATDLKGTVEGERIQPFLISRLWLVLGSLDAAYLASLIISTFASLALAGSIVFLLTKDKLACLATPLLFPFANRILFFFPFNNLEKLQSLVNPATYFHDYAYFFRFYPASATGPLFLLFILSAVLYLKERKWAPLIGLSLGLLFYSYLFDFLWACIFSAVLFLGRLFLERGYRLQTLREGLVALGILAMLAIPNAIAKVATLKSGRMAGIASNVFLNAWDIQLTAVAIFMGLAFLVPIFLLERKNRFVPIGTIGTLATVISLNLFTFLSLVIEEWHFQKTENVLLFSLAPFVLLSLLGKAKKPLIWLLSIGAVLMTVFAVFANVSAPPFSIPDKGRESVVEFVSGIETPALYSLDIHLKDVFVLRNEKGLVRQILPDYIVSPVGRLDAEERFVCSYKEAGIPRESLENDLTEFYKKNSFENNSEFDNLNYRSFFTTYFWVRSKRIENSSEWDDVSKELVGAANVWFVPAKDRERILSTFNSADCGEFKGNVLVLGPFEKARGASPERKWKLEREIGDYSVYLLEKV